MSLNNRVDRHDFVWRARIAASAPGRAAAHVGRHSFLVGAPLDFDPDSETVSALEYVLGALGADVLNGFRAEAKRRRLHLDHAEATVDGRVDNPLTYLDVVGERGHPGLVRVSVKVYASSLDSESALREAWTASLERSPLVHTLSPSVDLALELELVA